MNGSAVSLQQSDAESGTTQGLICAFTLGAKLTLELPQTTPMIATLHVHFSRASDLECPDHLVINPAVPVEGYRDSFGNWCNRLVAPGGRFTLGTNAVIRDAGASDPVDLNAVQHQVQHLPTDTLQFLLGSRYCETDALSEEAWRLFKHTPLGWPRVQAICDFVHNHLAFGYEHARPTRTAAEAYAGAARCLPGFRPPRDHLLPLPQHPGALLHRLYKRYRYPASHAPMDFAAWMEVYLGGRWFTFIRAITASGSGEFLLHREETPPTFP